MKSVLHTERFIEYSLHKRIVISILALITIVLPLNLFISKYNHVDGAQYVTKAPVPVQGKNWKLVFDDEFNGTSLDTKKWVPCFRWITATGCASSTTPETWYSPNNVSVSNGTLKLKAQKQAVTENGKSYPYTSSMITTGPTDNTGAPAKFLFTYGYTEIRAKVPKGQGLWPAFWALPTDDTNLPELDVSEVLTGAGLTTHTNTMTYSVKNDAAHISSINWTSLADLASDFHVYAADWEPDGIHWYVDGIERRAAFIDSKNITAKQMYLLVQLEVGGAWPGNPDSSTPFPSVYEIDYVKVWQHAH